MSCELAFLSCYQDSAPVRWSDLSEVVQAIYWFGDIVYMDATVGAASATGQLKAGVLGGAAAWPENGSGVQISIPAPVTVNGVAGTLPLAGWSVSNPGAGYPSTMAMKLAAGLSVEVTPLAGGAGSGATATAITHLITTGGVANGATTATLTKAPAAGDGTRSCTFGNGQVRSVTFAGTAISFAAMSGGGNPSVLDDGLGNIQSISPLTTGSGYTAAGTALYGFSRHNGTRYNTIARVNQVLNFKEAAAFVATRKDKGVKWYFMHDDHEYFNNWDHSVKQGVNGQTTQAQVLDYWREASAAWQYIVPKWFDNTFRPNTDPNGDMPPGQVGVVGRLGVAAPADFPLWYFAHDYDPNGALVNSGAPLAFKVVGIDCISAKSFIATPDSATKQMIGPQQEQWLYDQVQDAINRRAKHIILMSGKDYFNLDNTDGWGVPTDGSTHYPYIVQRDRIFQTIHNMLQGTTTGIIYMTGDRHCPHHAMRSVDNGDAYNAYTICATPFGSNSMGLTVAGYNELMGYSPEVDPIVHGAITYSEETQSTIVRIVDNVTNQDRARFEFAWGASLPTPSGMRGRRKLADYKTVPGIV